MSPTKCAVYDYVEQAINKILKSLSVSDRNLPFKPSTMYFHPQTREGGKWKTQRFMIIMKDFGKFPYMKEDCMTTTLNDNDNEFYRQRREDGNY